MTLNPTELDAGLAAALADYARTVKAATRVVSLYPATHPSIQSALARVAGVSARLTAGGDITLDVHPETIVIDGRSLPRPDRAVSELATLLHHHLIGQLRIEANAGEADFHELLLLLARDPEELIAEGGIARAWTLTGRSGFAIQEIDYAAVLRERPDAGGDTAGWDLLIANCLRDDSADFDERTIRSLLEIAGDPDAFGDFVARLQHEQGGARVGARAAALLRIIRSLVRAAADASADLDGLLGLMAESTARLTPEMMIAVLAQARSGNDTASADAALRVVERIGDRTVASFVAGNVVAERGATARLAEAFESLVPDASRRPPLLSAAHDEAILSPMGDDPGFEELWRDAAAMLSSYSDSSFVSAEYGNELSGARTRAIEVERVSDDPPERVQGWLSSVSDGAVQELDVDLLRDLLALENGPEAWGALSELVAAEVERLTLLGHADAARRLVEALALETGAGGRPALQPAASAALERLASGPLVKHVLVHLRNVDDTRVAPFTALCQALGPKAVRPLAEALAGEEHKRAWRRLRAVLLGFGAAGRKSVEPLTHSANPAVRRTAIDLLRVFGGADALPELASLLDDDDVQVRREAIRAITQIGTEDAFAVLQRGLIAADDRSRDIIVQQLIGLREEHAAALLCFMLDHTSPRGPLFDVHMALLEALGGLSDAGECIPTLRRLLRSGEWWSPIRTARLRQAAAIALRRIGTPPAIAELHEAAAEGSRGVRTAARTQIALVKPAGIRERTN